MEAETKRKKSKELPRLAAKFLVFYICTFACQVSAIGIIDYKPSEFSEHAAKPFFFSIGKKLKHGDAIREDAPTLFEVGLFDGHLGAIFPSPDQMKAAVVVGDRLYLVQPGKPTAQLLRPVCVNKASFEVRCYLLNLQWDSESRYILIPKTTGEPSLSERFNPVRYPQALVRIDTNDTITEQELIPASEFRVTSGYYFLLSDNSVCFKVGTKEGNVLWTCWISGHIGVVKILEDDRITFKDGSTINVKPFLSYSNPQGGEIWLALGGYSLTRVPKSMLVDFFHTTRPDVPIFRLEGAVESLKGHFVEGFHHNESAVLPGARYAFLSVFDRKLVVDATTGLYKEVPKDSRVYINANSYSHPGSVQVINHGDGWYGIDFVKPRPLRTNYTGPY